MKKILAALSVVVFAGAMATPALADNDDAPGKNKVTICHVTPGNSVTLTIPEDQANGHLTGKAAGHDINGPVEDYLGECRPEPTPTPTVTPEPTPTPTPEPTPTVTPEATPSATETPVVPTEAPVVVAPVEEAVVTPEKPASVTVPAAATVPSAVPAGDGSSQDGINWIVIAILTAATVVGAFALRKWNN